MWKDLSMQQRADLMDIYLSHGISSLDEMRNHYDSRNQFANGGNLFSDEDEPTQQMNSGLNLYRNTNKAGDVWYTYQETPDSEEILLTPTNKRFSDDPTNWDYKDASGREYTPRMAKPAVAQAELRPYEKDWYHKMTEALGYDWLVNKSNEYYNNPILGAAARWAASYDNNTNPIKGLWNSPLAYGNVYSMAAKAADNLFLNPNGLQKTIALYNNSDGSYADRNAWQKSLLGDVVEASMISPAVREAYKSSEPLINASKTYLQNNYPAVFDPYTSWDATLGYHGDNIFSRALGTVGRRYGYTPKAEVPEFHRRLAITKPESFRLTDDGKFIMSSGRTGEGHEGIVNFATSEAARSHNKHKYLSGIDDFIVHPKALENANWKSIQPSDTFLELPLDNSTLAIDPKYITFVSGEPEALNYARSIGMKTLSSPKLRALEANKPSFSGLLDRINTWKGAHSENARSIGNEIQRLTSMRGAPTMKDYAYFEDATGLNSGVVPSSQWTGINEEALFGRSSGVRWIPKFNNVAYDPATPIESIYRKAKTGEIPWSDYYEALEKMPSARQQLGLNSAMDTYLGEPVIPEGYLTIKPQVRTKVGDVEIDDPNLLYHLDRGNGVGAFSNQGAYVENGMLLPGIAKEGEVPYSWWNLGRPYSTSVNGQPMTRLMTTTKDSPGMLHVRSQNYPIGQWNGKRGFVTNAEYVNPEGVNISGSTYALDPNYGWRRIFAEETPAAEWPVGRTTPQITAENAAKNSSIMADANDFSYKGLTSNMSDFFEKLMYSNKIHGKPMVPSDEGVGGFSKSVQVGIPKTEYDELLHDVVGRNIREFKQAGLSDVQVSNYINNAKDAMDNVHIGMYSDSDYIKGGWEGFGGFYDSEGNFISVNTGSPLPKTKIVKHEGRHLLDHKVDDEILTPASENFGKDFDSDIALSTMQKVKQNQNMTLYDAYDNDFMTLPSKEGFNEGLEGYSNMDREAITTNLDSRNELLGSKAGWDLDITDKIIDKMPDTAIFDAVEKANGYGRRYIRFLRENNKLTPEKAKQFREAMKHVGAIATPVGIGYGLSQGNE